MAACFFLYLSLARINYRRVTDLHHMSTLSACWWLSRVILSQHEVPGSRFVISRMYTTFHRTFLRWLMIPLSSYGCARVLQHFWIPSAHNSLHRKNSILARDTRRKSDSSNRLIYARPSLDCFIVLCYDSTRSDHDSSLFTHVNVIPLWCLQYQFSPELDSIRKNTRLLSEIKTVMRKVTYKANLKI